MAIKKCKTCKWWDPYGLSCFKTDKHRTGDNTCGQWEKHECICGGILEVIEHEGYFFARCDSCHIAYDYKLF